MVVQRNLKGIDIWLFWMYTHMMQVLSQKFLKFLILKRNFKEFGNQAIVLTLWGGSHFGSRVRRRVIVPMLIWCNHSAFFIVAYV